MGGYRGYLICKLCFWNSGKKDFFIGGGGFFGFVFIFVNFKVFHPCKYIPLDTLGAWITADLWTQINKAPTVFFVG